MGPKRLKRATAVRFWCSWYPTQYFWIRPVILDRFQGPGRSFSDQKWGLKSKSRFSGHPRYLHPKLRTSDQNALKQTGSEGPQNLSMGFWHVKHQFYLPAQKCSNLTHPNGLDSCCVLARALVVTNHTEPGTPRCPRGKLGSDVKIDVLGVHYHLFKGWID